MRFASPQLLDSGKVVVDPDDAIASLNSKHRQRQAHIALPEDRHQLLATRLGQPIPGRGCAL